MNRLIPVAACFLLAGFAPAPLFNLSERDLNKLLGGFERVVEEAVTELAALDAIARRKKVLQTRLKRHILALRHRDMYEEADAVHDMVLMIESIDGTRPLGKSSVAACLHKATADGRYRSLLRVVYVPGDRGSHGDFLAYGFWNGTTYGGATDLPPGYWVYLAPRWYVWAEQTPPATK